MIDVRIEVLSSVVKERSDILKENPDQVLSESGRPSRDLASFS